MKKFVIFIVIICALLILVQGAAKQSISCSDSDGFDIFESGLVSFILEGKTGEKTLKDSCQTKNSVKEYFCAENEPIFSVESCPDGTSCHKGACQADFCSFEHDPPASSFEKPNFCFLRAQEFNTRYPSTVLKCAGVHKGVPVFVDDTSYSQPVFFFGSMTGDRMIARYSGGYCDSILTFDAAAQCIDTHGSDISTIFDESVCRGK